MKVKVLAGIFATVFAGAVAAVDVQITGDGPSMKFFKLESMTVQSNGTIAIVVKAADDGTQPPGDGGGTQPPGDGGGTDPIGAACPASSATYKYECTQVPDQMFTRVTRNPAPTEVNVFRIGPFSVGQRGAVNATVTTANKSGKLIVLSDTRETISPASVGRACAIKGNESTTVRYRVVAQPNAGNRSECEVAPGKYYYAHVLSRDYAGTAPNCTTTSNCGFYFEAN